MCHYWGSPSQQLGVCSVLQLPCHGILHASLSMRRGLLPQVMPQGSSGCAMRCLLLSMHSSKLGQAPGQRSGAHRLQSGVVA